MPRLISVRVSPLPTSFLISFLSSFFPAPFFLFPYSFRFYFHFLLVINSIQSQFELFISSISRPSFMYVVASIYHSSNPVNKLFFSPRLQPLSFFFPLAIFWDVLSLNLCPCLSSQQVLRSCSFSHFKLLSLSPTFISSPLLVLPVKAFSNS